MNINSIKFGKRSKRSSKYHIFTSGNAYCDSNLKGIIESEVILNDDICSNCLKKVYINHGSLAAAYIELSFYFKQYSGGSSFLDSISSSLDRNKLLSSRQLEASIKIFRDGKFRGVTDSGINGLYETKP